MARRRAAPPCRHGRRRVVSGAPQPQPPTRIGAGEREEHHGRVGFTRGVAAGEVAPSHVVPLFSSDDMRAWLTDGSQLSATQIRKDSSIISSFNDVL